MSEEGTMTGSTIKNVGVLDLRQATEASVAGIDSIGNVGTVLYSPETAPLLQRLRMGNVGSTVEAAADAQLRRGRVRFTDSTFQAQKEPVRLIISGQLIVEAGVAREDLERGLAELVVMGSILCPEHLAGSLQVRLSHLDGDLETYGQDATLIIGNLHLDEPYLQALPDGASLMITGSLVLPQVLPDDVLARKIEHLQVARRITCHAENAETLLARLERRASGPQMRVIPVGHTLVDRPLLLDRPLLQALPVRKLYCTELVRIGEGVSAELLESALEALVATELVICPSPLQEVLLARIDVLNTRTIFYDGELWVIDGVRELNEAQFDYLKGEATLLVQGVLTVGRDVAPELLAERLAQVHNLGVISGASGQLASLQARMGIQEGVLEDSEAPAGTSRELGNSGYLRL